MKVLMRLHVLHPVIDGGKGDLVLINPMHIAAVIPDGAHSKVLTTPGVVYLVYESVEEVEREVLELLAQLQD